MAQLMLQSPIKAIFDVAFKRSIAELCALENSLNTAESFGK